MEINMTSTKQAYPIGVVKRMTGLTARQIRYYEKQGLVMPARSKGNQRLYSKDDIKKIKTIKKLLAEGLNMAGIKKMF